MRIKLLNIHVKGQQGDKFLVFILHSIIAVTRREKFQTDMNTIPISDMDVVSSFFILHAEDTRHRDQENLTRLASSKMSSGTSLTSSRMCIRTKQFPIIYHSRQIQLARKKKISIDAPII